MWNYVDGIFVKSIDRKDEAKYAKEFETWDISNSKILTWINNYVSLSIGMKLVKYHTTKDAYDHLKCLYNQSNFTKWYQLKSDIRALSKTI